MDNPFHITHLINCYNKNFYRSSFKEICTNTHIVHQQQLQPTKVLSSNSSAAHIVGESAESAGSGEINHLLLSVSLVIIRPLQHLWPCVTAVSQPVHLEQHRLVYSHSVTHKDN